MANAPWLTQGFPIGQKTSLVQFADVQVFGAVLAQLLDDGEEGANRVEVSNDAGGTEVLARHAWVSTGLVIEFGGWVKRENLMTDFLGEARN